MKKIQEIAMECLSVTQILFKTQLEWTLQNNKTCTPRYLYGEYSQLLIIESNQSCLRINAVTVRQRHIQNPVENLQWSILTKTVNGFRSLTIHPKM